MSQQAVPVVKTIRRSGRRVCYASISAAARANHVSTACIYRKLRSHAKHLQPEIYDRMEEHESTQA